MASLSVRLPLVTLAMHVLFAHVDGAVESEEGADTGGGDAMLSGAGFGDDALLAHTDGEQSLADGVVDLVCAGVKKILTLEVDFGASESFAEALGVIKRRGASGVVLEQVSEFGLKLRIEAGFGVGLFEFFERCHQDFGNVASAIGTEVTSGIRQIVMATHWWLLPRRRPSIRGRRG
jgi:hypothetical protein